jgi:hypothetical protein
VTDADLVEAGIYPTSEGGFEHGLVVLAMGQPYWLIPSEAGFRLLVEPGAFEEAREQLARFDRESVGWPPRKSMSARTSPDSSQVLCLVLAPRSSFPEASGNV